MVVLVLAQAAQDGTRQDALDEDVLLKHQLLAIRTGRATSALVENIRVDYYGTMTPLGQLGSISIPEPRQILKALPQVEFVEMPEAGTCCGMGGTYSVYHYETSKKIGARKAANIATSGAQLVATDCPGCIMQLQDSINHAVGGQRAIHILELLAEALPDPG